MKVLSRILALAAAAAIAMPVTVLAQGDDEEIEEITVKVHLSGVYRKLHATNRTQAVRIAMQLGWAV